MAARNAADAQSLLDTVESAHNEINSILQRMRELAVQGANDTNGTADHTNIRLELTELSEEIDAIKTQTGLKRTWLLPQTHSSSRLVMKRTSS